MPVRGIILEMDGEKDLVDPIDEPYFLRRWPEVARKLVRRQRDDAAPVADVFLGIHGDEAKLLDAEYLRSVVQIPLQHIWTANLYVVFPYAPGRKLATPQKPRRPFYPFESLRTAGVTDVLQVAPGDLESRGALRRACALSRGRRAVLERTKARGPWRFCMAPMSSTSKLPFVEDFEAHAKGTHPGQNLITLVADSRGLENLPQFVRAPRQPAAGPRLVVTLGSEPSPDLRRCCNEAGIPLVHCQGLLELRYLLHKLNGRCAPTAAWRPPEDVAAPRDAPAQPPGARAGEPPLLLLTSALPLQPSDASPSCVTGARHVEAAREAAAGMAYRLVHAAITTGALSRLAKSHDEMFAWVHIGHGHYDGGLFEFESQLPTGLSLWLGCLEKHLVGLPLAFFSACFSEDVARRCAAGGVRFAVGFAGRASPCTCEFLVRRVIHAALRSQGDPARIGEAYEQGCAELQACHAESLRRAQPRAFRFQP